MEFPFIAAMQHMPQITQQGDPSPHLANTLRQLNALVNVVNNMESLCKTFESASVNSDAVIPKTDPHAADSASTTIITACNRIMEIMQDDARWAATKESPEEARLTREERKLDLRRKKIELDVEELKAQIQKRLMRKQERAAAKQIEGI